MKTLIQNGKKILQELNDAGYEAFFVGGFVRDQCLNIASSDIDITTNARPESIESLFKKTIPTGKKYGTVTVLMDDFSFEVTTYRLDQNYTNHRQPESVEFSKQLKEDLIRRDFTINALVQDVDGEIIDMFDGKKDIDQGIIRAINNPLERFKEDALRILRAIRFVGKLGFSVETQTLQAMKADVKLLNQLPKERVVKEFDLIFKQPHKSKIYNVMNLIDLHLAFLDLDQGIGKLINKDISITFEELFALSLYPNKKLNAHKWRLSNKQATTIEGIVELMNILKKQRLTPILAYNHQKELMLSADKLLSVFYDETEQRNKIIHLYRHMVIDSYQDLDISGRAIKQMVSNKNHVGIIIKKLIEEVLYERIENKQDALSKYAREVAEALDETG